MKSRFWGALAGFGALATLGVTNLAQGIEIRVRGAGSIELLATERGSDTVLRGVALDEVGASMGRVPLRIETLSEGRRGEPLGQPRSCDEGQPPSARLVGKSYEVTSDERGLFCLVLRAAPPNTSFRVLFAGNKFYEGSDSVASPVKEGEERVQTTLRFDSPPTQIDLDKPQQAFSLSLKLSRLDAAKLLAGGVKQEGHEVVLKDDAGTILGRTRTRGDGKAKFEIDSAALLGPGDGEIIAEFAGSGVLGSSKASVPVTRVASPTLLSSSSIEGDADGGIALPVDVTSSHGEVSDGVIEAYAGSEPVGTGIVHAGKATVLISFSNSAARTVPVTLRYLPSGPYWRGATSGPVDVVVSGPGVLKRLALAAMGAGLAAWIVLRWRRAPKEASKESANVAPPSGRPEVLVLERPAGIREWRGTVQDAHDGFPIANAELRVSTPGFSGHEVHVKTRTDEAGHFHFDVPEVSKHAVLTVEGELHAVFEQALPPPSVLRVALVTRRRALLDRLVRWARTKGPPFDGTKEPTPGHVRRVAHRIGVDGVEKWAARIEGAAFGPEPVTRTVEQAISGQEPSAHHPLAPP